MTPQAPGLRLAFEAQGSGPPLIILHGLFGSGANWGRVAALLATSYRVYSVDLRNHGASPRALSMSYDEMADDLLRLIEQEGLERPHLIGHSMGGKVAMTLALARPYAVGGLTIVDIAPVTYLDHWSHSLQVMSRCFGVPEADDLAGPSRTLWRCLANTPFALQGEYVDWRADLGAIGLSIQTLCAFPRQLRYLTCDVPLHAIVGGRSDCVRAPRENAFAPMFTRVTIDVVEDAGHWVHAERPDAIVQALLPRRQARPAPAAVRRAPERPQPPRRVPRPRRGTR